MNLCQFWTAISLPCRQGCAIVHGSYVNSSIIASSSVLDSFRIVFNSIANLGLSHSVCNLEKIQNRQNVWKIKRNFSAFCTVINFIEYRTFWFFIFVSKFLVEISTS